jgi:23S rRNA (cytidine1920-2'-O)/16S rRNA (cytidine1409-2'-O)-methyltransferase
MSHYTWFSTALSSWRSGPVVGAEQHDYVSRGGLKLAAALDGFGLEPAGWICADFGSNVGGFVDCLLQQGATRVYAVDTGYGTLAWRLRKDDRVVVMERTNAMHVRLPEPVDLVTIDVAWTRQCRIVPNALRVLRPGGRIITLIKPHYEAPRDALRDGVLDTDHVRGTVAAVCEQLAEAGTAVEAVMPSPIAGQKGNLEYLALLRRANEGEHILPCC